MAQEGWWGIFPFTRRVVMVPVPGTAAVTQGHCWCPTAMPALHWRAGITQQGYNAAAKECWGLELLCTEVFSIYCNLCPGSGGTIEPSVRAVLGISKCKTVCGSLCVTYTGKVQKISVNCKRHVNCALLNNACWLFIADWFCRLNLHEQQKGVWWEGT